MASSIAEKKRWLALSKGLLSCPTAPLMEDLPARHIREFAAQRKGLALKSDRCGNIFVKYRGQAPASRPPLVLVAHLDHPGFWVNSVKGTRAELPFKGGVAIEHAVKGSRLRFYRRGDKASIGQGVLLSAKGEKGRLVAATAKIVSGEADPKGYAMWDFPGFSIRANKVVARCCDDLLGAAAAMCVLDECVRRGPKFAGMPVWALFSRAEEIGFYGALTSLNDGLLPKKAGVISLECSRALPTAPQGAGVIVRVGDRTSIFDPFYTECLTRACMALQKKDKRFRFRRKLMDGGTCEATVYCANGYRSSGLALPLGNYHNQAGLDGGKKKIGPESVHVDDFVAEVRLLLELARNGHRLDKLADFVPKALAKRAKAAEKEFKARPLI